MVATLVRDMEKDDAVVTDADVVNDPIPKNETKRSAPDNQVPLLINTFVNPIGISTLELFRPNVSYLFFRYQQNVSRLDQ